MILRPDTRHYDSDSDKYGFCRSCGSILITLPGDRRNGYCFECYSALQKSDEGTERQDQSSFSRTL